MFGSKCTDICIFGMAGKKKKDAFPVRIRCVQGGADSTLVAHDWSKGPFI